MGKSQETANLSTTTSSMPVTKSLATQNDPVDVNRDVGKLYGPNCAFIVGDNLPMMRDAAAKVHLKVISSAWLSLTDVTLEHAAKAHFNAMGSPKLEWIPWCSETVALPGASQRTLRDRLTRNLSSDWTRL